MVTAGEKLSALSGLSNVSAETHLCAITAGTGTQVLLPTGDLSASVQLQVPMAAAVVAQEAIEALVAGQGALEASVGVAGEVETEVTPQTAVTATIEAQTTLETTATTSPVACPVPDPVFPLGAIVADDWSAAVKSLAVYADTAGPQTGDALALGGVDLPGYDLRIVEGDVTVDTFVEDEWFTVDPWVEDARGMIVIVRGSLTIPAGQVFQPSIRRPYLVVYATETLAVEGGLSMTRRGADHSAATGSNVAAGAMAIWGAYEVPTVGADGAPQTTVPTPSGGTAFAGSAGVGGQTGGGGGGACSSSNPRNAGAGAPGTAYTGGSGAGGNAWASQADGGPSKAAIDGGPGGMGIDLDSGGERAVGGGAGNPGGGWSVNLTGVAQPGDDGTGGILIAFCGTYANAAGTVSADGANGGDSNATASAGFHSCGGGGSGGGVAEVFAGVDLGGPTPTADGGNGGVATTGGNARQGGPGGLGTAQVVAGWS